MGQYIKKSDIVAEIERRRKEIPKNETDKTLKTVYGNEAFVLTELLSFLNTLEVKEMKEVDVENAAITEWDDYIKKIDGEPNYAYMLIKKEDYISLAKHFYELDLKARKED